MPEPELPLKPHHAELRAKLVRDLALLVYLSRPSATAPSTSEKENRYIPRQPLSSQEQR